MSDISPVCLSCGYPIGKIYDLIMIEKESTDLKKLLELYHINTVCCRNQIMTITKSNYDIFKAE